MLRRMRGVYRGGAYEEEGLVRWHTHTHTHTNSFCRVARQQTAVVADTK